MRQAELDHPFDAVFVDWKMPDLDGIETARLIRAEGRSPRIIMVTAFGKDDVRAQADAVGIDAFLVKPVSQSSLLDAILTLFGLHVGVPSSAASIAESSPALNGTHVLLAEDNEINQQIAVELLEGAGAIVTVAADGQAALKMIFAAEPSHFDAVLMDVQMPILDGIEATRRIRTEERFAKLPIIAMTAHALAEERERCLLAGMVDHIAKPIDPQAMFQTLQRWIQPLDLATNLAATTDAAAASASECDLSGIEGFDPVAGLKRAGGNQALYQRLVRQFVKKEANAASRIAAAFAAGDHAAAERIAHTINGVAGNIGLNALQNSAMLLERTIRMRDDTVAAFHQFDCELKNAVTALQRAFGNASRQAEAIHADASGHVRHLAALLAASNGEAVSYFIDHASAVRSLFDDDYPVFEKAITEFDFVAALDRLRLAAALCGLALQEGA